MRKMDLSGREYGQLLVLAFSHRTENGTAYYKCQCSCGVQKLIAHGCLQSGDTKTCGCRKLLSTSAPNYSHGMSGTKVYKAWTGIKSRCYSPSSTSFERYGGKGVTMSQTLQDSFTSFYEEIGDPPDNSAKWSVERIDNSLGYSEGNLTWALPEQQARNKGKRKDNSSGETGVCFRKPKGLNHDTYCCASWKDINGRPQTRKFSVKKLGLLPAFKAAVECRRKMIGELNQMGANYTKNHGK